MWRMSEHAPGYCSSRRRKSREDRKSLWTKKKLEQVSEWLHKHSGVCVYINRGDWNRINSLKNCKCTKEIWSETLNQFKRFIATFLLKYKVLFQLILKIKVGFSLDNFKTTSLYQNTRGYTSDRLASKGLKFSSELGPPSLSVPFRNNLTGI